MRHVVRGEVVKFAAVQHQQQLLLVAAVLQSVQYLDSGRRGIIVLGGPCPRLPIDPVSVWRAHNRMASRRGGTRVPSRYQAGAKRVPSGTCA